MVKKRGLGRGLDALLGGIDENKNKNVRKPDELGGLRNLSIDLIQPGRYQPRQTMNADSLEELANSIRSQGVVQPIVVRPLDTKDNFEIIAGERRWRAAQLAGVHEIPALVRDVPDEAAIAMALIENIQREDLNPIEEANALQRLINEFGMTHQQAADAVGRSRASVTNLLRLLTLAEDVKKLVDQGLIEMGHARALLSLEGDQQIKLALDIVARGLSVRETEQAVRRIQLKPEPPAKTEEVLPDIKKFQDDLSERLGAKVVIKHSLSGSGKLSIHYNNLDELEGILAHVR